MRIVAIIPARFASTRLPGKPLADIGGKSMVQRVVERVRKAKRITAVVVATDDERVAVHVRSFGGTAVITSPEHPSGTDRCYEALMIMGADDVDAIVNVQGDEPFIEPAQIDEVCETLEKAEGGIATLAQVVQDDHELDNAGEVLITTDIRMNALYFSRAAIPYLHGHRTGPRYSHFRFLKHVGIYAYRKELLERLVRLAPSPLEKAESLEQLRWLENGYKVQVGITAHPSFCVDTPADLEEAIRRVEKDGEGS